MYTTREFARMSVFSLAALLGLARPAPGQTLSSDELGALLDKETLTNAEHLKLADYYSAEAEELENNAKRHAALAVRSRRARNLPPKVAKPHQGMSQHCENFSKSLSNAAKASQDLAAAHREMAKESN